MEDLALAYASEDEEVAPGTDVSTLPHQGRVRSFPHVVGNYPTHVFISVAVPAAVAQHVEALLAALRAVLPRLQPMQQPDGSGSADSGGQAGAAAASPPAQAEYHLSLSRTVAVRYREIDSLLEVLRDCLRKQEGMEIGFDAPAVLVNDERTRTFVALTGAARRKGSGDGGVGGGGGAAPDPLLLAIKRVSRAFQMHRLPEFHQDPQPHVSLAWLLGDEEAAARAALGDPGVRAASAALSSCGWAMEPASILCRIGQKVYPVWRGLAG